MPLFDPSVRDTTARDFDWLEAAWRRSMVAQSSTEGPDRIVAKLANKGGSAPVLRRAFAGVASDVGRAPSPG